MRQKNWFCANSKAKLGIPFGILILFQVLNAFQNIQPKNGWEDGESNVGDDQSFQHDEASVPASLHFTKRGLASAPAFTSRMESEDEDKYIEISKLRPRSLGMMSTGSQLQKMALNSGDMVNMESRRQDLYLDHLRKRGQLIEMEDGSSKLVSLSQLPLRMPRTLKNKNFSQWLDREKVWANVTHFPWSLDDECKVYSVQFGRQLPIVGLASYPSSGNTWLRYLIEGATGYFTGSMYNDVAIAHKGYYGEGIAYDSGMTVAIKSHGFTTGNYSLAVATGKLSKEERRQHNHITELNSTAILLIRNPFKAIIGHRNLDEGGHTGHAKELSFQGLGWDRFVSIKIKSWELFYMEWLSSEDDGEAKGLSSHRVKVVHFENLQDMLQWNLLSILDFLSLRPDPGRIECLLKHEEGLFRRKSKGSQMDFDPFTAAQKKKIRVAIDKVNGALSKASKETIPLHKYEFL